MSSSTKSVKKKKNGGTKKKTNGNGNHSSANELRTINKLLKQKYAKDLRGPNALGKPVQNTTVNPSIPIQVAVSANAYSGVILGAISTALSRGWSLNAFDDNFPYWAFIYQVELIIQAAQGGIPYAAMIPYWLSTVVQAVIKKTVEFENGNITYAQIINDELNNAFEQAIGPIPFKHVYSLGIKTDTKVNARFPIIDPPLAYTTENGQRATQSLWLFFANTKSHPEMHKMVKIGNTNGMTYDTSAMAYFQPTPGNGQNGTGGWFNQVYHEKPITAPLYSKFSPLPTKSSFTNRSNVHMRVTGGDSIFLGAMLVDFLDKHQIKMRNHPCIQFIDFNELLDQFALACTKAVEARLATDSFIDNVINDPGYYVREVQCPLTFQEFALAFRAACMLVYTDTIKCQGVYPRVATSSNDNEFVTYVCGIQGCPIPMTNMMLMPKLLQENILANQTRTLYADKPNPKVYMSCLGQYENDRLSTNDYTVTYVIDGDPFTQNVFADDVGEVPISLIDGNFGGGICAINEPAAIIALNALFNEWIQFMGDHFRMLDTVASDNGVGVLSTVGMTAHFLTGGERLDFKKVEEPKAPKKDKKKPVIVSRFKKNVFKRERPSLFNFRDLIAYTTRDETVDNAWSELQQFWVVPINKIDPPSLQVGDNTGFNRIGGFLGQGNQIDVATGSTVFSTIGERNENAANMMVKTKFAQETAAEATLRELTEQGKGGILGTAGAAILGELTKTGINVGIDMLGNYVGSLIPI